MSVNEKDYTTLSKDELRREQKKARRVETLHAVFIGFLLGIMLYGIAKGGFGFVYVFIPILLIYGTHKSSKKYEKIVSDIQQHLDAMSNES